MNRKLLKKVPFWGASVSTHQVEGGNHNQWTVWELEHAAELAKAAPQAFGDWLPSWERIKKQASSPENYVSARAADHYNRYEHDLDIMKKLNMNMFRSGIEWARIQPTAEEWVEKEIEHYRMYIRAMRARGIEPMITLWHWTMPVWFVQRGGFEKRRNVRLFVDYCERIIEALKDDLRYVVILNEPMVYSSEGYWKDRWPPQAKSPLKTVLVVNNLVRAHKLVAKRIRNQAPHIRIGIAKSSSHITATDNSLLSGFSVWAAEFMWDRQFLGRIKKQLDFIGVNYYFTNRFAGLKNVQREEQLPSDYGWDMEPRNIQFVLERLYDRYQKPMFVTENGLADAQDEHRKWWLKETLEGLSGAIKNGVDLDGYLHWSLLDNFEWADGFWPQFGLVEVDRKTMKRTVRKSAKWYGEMIKSIRR